MGETFFVIRTSLMKRPRLTMIAWHANTGGLGETNTLLAELERDSATKYHPIQARNANITQGGDAVSIRHPHPNFPTGGTARYLGRIFGQSEFSTHAC